jgi:predicted alpha/beta hydrolase family esterase
MFNTPHVSGLDESDPEHWVNEWGFELIKKRDNPAQT